MNRSFFARWGLWILCLVFFLVPFALRGARMAVERLENNVKDWLPPSFAETSELTWFGKHFLGEQFIVVTWQGCSADDPSYRLLAEKLRREIQPPEFVDQDIDPETLTEEQRRAYRKQLHRVEARRLGNELGLFTTDDYRENWGGREERWLLDRHDRWYFITPDGKLYRWSGGNNLVGAILVGIRRLLGDTEARGELVAQLGEPPTENDQNDFYDDPRRLNARLFSSLTTGPDVLQELAQVGGPLWPIGGDLSEEERAELARHEALERLTGTLFGPDGKQTCLIVTLTEEAKKDLRRVVGRGVLGKPRGRLIQMADDAGVEPPPSPPVTPFTPERQPERVLRLGGPPVDNVAIDEEGQITLVRLVGFSALLGIVLSYLAFRSVKITIMVFFVGGISAVASVSLVYWTGASVDAILMSMPSLVYVLGLSGAVHIVNYYRDAVREGGLPGAPERALSHGWGPCSLAAFTTSLGLLSLCLSNILPIRKFGFYSALGVMATLTVLFTYLPSALQIWPPVPRRTRDEADSDGNGNKISPEQAAALSAGAGTVHRAVTSFWLGIGERVIRRHGWVTVACLLILVAFAVGLPKIRTDVQLLKLFDASAKIIRDYTWLEAHLGKLVPMELVAEVDERLQRPSSLEQSASELSEEEVQRRQLQYSFLERMEIGARIQAAVEKVLGEEGQGVVGRGISAASFAPTLPPPSVYRTRLILNRKLEESRERMMEADYLAVDDQTQHELWRISLRLGALNDVDYGRFVGTLRQVVEPILSAYHHRDETLSQLVEQKGGESLRAARICVLGLPNPHAEPPGEGGEKPGAKQAAGDAPSFARPGSEEAAVAQTELFARTLHDLFEARNFRPSSRAPKFLYWHDHATAEPPEGTTYEEALRELLGHFDCVIVAADHEKADFTAVRQMAEAGGALLVDARDHVYRAGEPTAKDRGELISVTYTGVVPIVYKAQRTLLTSLIESIGWAFVMIAGVMMLVLRSGRLSPGNLFNFRGGLASMLPNVFPVVVIFGFMGHAEILVDIGTMMTASVAMGVAVDDTIHYLAWFRSGLARGLSRPEAILLAYRRVGPAMTQTTIIGGLGLSIFALSTFTPTQRFGTMMLTLLVAALFGDLIFLPALLAGPLGRFFGPPSTKQGASSPSRAEREPEKSAPRPEAPQPQAAHSGLRGSHSITSRLHSG